METVEKPPELIISDRCRLCGFGYRPTINGKLANWCSRCRDVIGRRSSITPEQIDRFVCDTVELKYSMAQMSDLSEDIALLLAGVEYGRDIYMYGGVGVGKTYAMAALIRYYIGSGFKCTRLNFNDFCVSVRSTFSSSSKITEEEMIKPLKEVDKLFIDDLGLSSEEESKFSYQTLYSILNKRQERMLPTFISSNKTIEQIGQTFDARIASRLQGALIIKMTGKDRRVKCRTN
jgi:DNA replication protein DnaC